MMFTIFIVFFSLIVLVILHELGHFLVAKYFGVKVEEFGIFLPPRLFGKKIGETIYSINLIPFGAFVRLYGEEVEETASPQQSALGLDDSRSFSAKPIWQRALIVLGGVISFWLIAAVLMSIVMGLGAPLAVGDEESDFANPEVQIASVAPDSPAQTAGLRIGDTILALETTQFNGQALNVDKIKQVQEFTEQYKGKEIIFKIKRGVEVFEVVLIPRVSWPEGQGPVGLVLARIVQKSYPWYEAPIKGVVATFQLTGTIILALADFLGNLVLGKGIPSGAQVMGPVGIANVMTQFAQLGLNYYLRFLAVISIYLAIFNILPIPALDGGKLIFLGIERIKGRSVNQKTEQRITAFFFGALLLLILFITIKDIIRLFQ